MLRQDEDRKTIADVKAILSNGSFQLDVTPGVVALSANMTLDEQKRTISAAEFETLPSHLLLTSGVVTSESISDEDADRPLPPNISNSQDREVYVMRFIKMNEVVGIIAKAVKKLSDAGHPDFQKKELTIPGEIRVSVLRELAKKQEMVLAAWRVAFATYRTTYPILSMLSRRQIVVCLSALRQEPPGPLLHHVLASIGCPLKCLSTLAAKIGKDVGSKTAAELAAVVARLLKDHLVPGQWVSQPWGLHIAELPNVTTDLGIYKLVTVPGVFCPSSQKKVSISAPVLEEVAIGMFVARHSRFPTPIEWLVATPNTSRIDIEDFLYRCHCWQTLQEPWEKCHATFVILHVSELSYAVQTHLILKLREFANLVRAHKVRAPLLLLSAADSGSYFVANALARDEVVLQDGVVMELCKLVGAALPQAKLPVHVAHSHMCGAGKTFSVIRAMSTKEIPHIQLSVDVMPLEHVLQRLDKARPLVAGQKTVVHFNLGHRGDAREIGAIHPGRVLAR